MDTLIENLTQLRDEAQADVDRLNRVIDGVSGTTTVRISDAGRDGRHGPMAQAHKDAIRRGKQRAKKERKQTTQKGA